MTKIYSVVELINKLNLAKHKKLKIALCHGVFDLIHIGHVRYLKKAKSIADILVVSITADKFIKKGFNSPHFNEKIRLEVVSSFSFVDYVILSESETSVNVINLIKPDFYVKGSEYKKIKEDRSGNIIKEINAVRKNRGKIIFTNEIRSSSTKLLNKYFDSFNLDQKEFLKKIKSKFSIFVIYEILKKFKNINVTVLGEIILDKYYFGDAIGKSGKEPHLVLKEKKTEVYLGGSLAVARHVSSFVNSVSVISFLSNDYKERKFLNKNLQKNIKLKTFLPKKDFISITKKRFLDINSNYKLLGSYILPDFKNENFDLQILKKFMQIRDKQLLIVTDYGHGLISPNLIKHFRRLFKFISVNAQLNSSNAGVHSIQKYKNVDLIVINETELRHELRDGHSDIKELIKFFFSKMVCKNLVVTKGRNGVVLYDGRSFFDCPAFAISSIDKIGAGDAMLSILSVCLKNNIDKNLSLFFGSIAASFSVQTVGNKRALDQKHFLNYIENAIK